MRIIVFFDLPVVTNEEKRVARWFRKFLLDDGYKMLQYSVYARLCNGIDNAESHFARLSKVTPQTGSIRCLIVTEKQYASMRILVGKRLSADKPSEYVQLTFL